MPRTIGIDAATGSARTPTLVLHQYDESPFCDKARRMLAVKRVPYEIHEITPSSSARELRRLGGIGKLPVLQDGDRLIADSTDIAEHLEARFPDPALLPEDPRDLARCHMLEDWADESLYFVEMTMRFTWKHNARRAVPLAVAHDARWFRALSPVVVPFILGRRARAQGTGRKPPEMVLRDLDRHLDALEVVLDDREWLVGGRLSLADIAVAVQLSCIEGTEEGAAAIGRRTATAAWLRRTLEASAPVAPVGSVAS